MWPSCFHGRLPWPFRLLSLAAQDIAAPGWANFHSLLHSTEKAERSSRTKSDWGIFRDERDTVGASKLFTEIGAMF